MNIAESMIYVFKNRRSELFGNFWNNDVKNVLRGVKDDVKDFFKTGAGKFRELRKQGIKETLTEIKDTTVDSVTVFKVVPHRIRQGLAYFQQDLSKAIEDLPDPSQKSLLVLKVIGVLCSFTLSTIYGLKKTQKSLSFSGMKMRNAVAQVIATELLVRVIQVFTLRLIHEIEQQVSDDEDRKKLRSFKKLLEDNDLADNSQASSKDLDSKDKAYAIVESFKTYMLTGERVEP